DRRPARDHRARQADRRNLTGGPGRPPCPGRARPHQPHGRADKRARGGRRHRHPRARRRARRQRPGRRRHRRTRRRGRHPPARARHPPGHPGGSVHAAHSRQRELSLTRAGAAMTGLLRSEWIKLRSVRSTYLTCGLTMLIPVGVGAAIAASVGTAVKDGRWHGTYDPTAASFYALPFAQLALAVGGVLAVSGEYSTGTIRTSLTAVPRRGHFLAAKAAVFALVTLAVSEATAFCCFFTAQPLLAP